MEMVFESILKILPDDAQVCCSRPTAKIISLRKVSNQDGVADSNVLYVSSEMELAKIKNKRHMNLLLYTKEKLTREVVGQASNVIVLNSLDDYIEVVERMADTLTSSSNLDNISRRMLEINHDSGDINRILQYAYELLNNPLMLVDVSFNVIAHAGTEFIKNEKNWSYAIENKMFSSDYISHVMKNLDDDGTGIRIEEPYDVASVAQYSTKVYRNNMVLGYVKLLELNHKVTAGDLEILKLLSYHLTFSHIGVQNKITGVLSLAEDFMYSLLEEKITDKYQILTRKELYNLKFYRYLYVIRINLVETTYKGDMVYYAFQRVKAYFSNNFVLWIDGGIVVLYDTNDADCIENIEWLTRFIRLLEELDCIANISMPFRELYNISNSYKQTMFCVEFRSLSNDYSRILNYKDIFEYHMLMNMDKQISLSDLLHPAVKTLIQSESPSAGELLNTLFAYTLHKCSISATAKVMFLHYNTLKNRMNQIEAMTGFTGENGRDRFWIMLSEKILKFLDMKKKSEADVESGN